MLALASLLVRLRDDPAVLGKRYQLTVNARAGLLPTLRAIPGVAAATQRYEIQAADAFRLGEPVKLVAYRGDHTRFDGAAARERPADRGATGRPRSGRAWRTRSGCASARRWRRSTRPARSCGCASSASSARSTPAGGSPGCSEDAAAARATARACLRLEPGADRAAVVRAPARARPAADARGRGDLAQRRVPVDAGLRAARGRAAGRARLPVRARPGPGHDRPRATRRAGGAARVRRIAARRRRRPGRRGRRGRRSGRDRRRRARAARARTGRRSRSPPTTPRCRCAPAPSRSPRSRSACLLAALAAALVARRLAAEPVVTGLREDVA